MITTSKKQTSYNHAGNNWSFMPTLLNGLAGVGIGMVIGNYLGWL